MDSLRGGTTARQGGEQKSLQDKGKKVAVGDGEQRTASARILPSCFWTAAPRWLSPISTWRLRRRRPVSSTDRVSAP